MGVGGNATSGKGGSGGPGFYSNITGTFKYYGAGGGGGSWNVSLVDATQLVILEAINSTNGHRLIYLPSTI